jgi:hypothetical protein
MKQLVSKHEMLLGFWKNSRDVMVTELQKVQDQIDDMNQKIDFYYYQIKCAKEEGKDMFDRDKYKIKDIDQFIIEF